MIKLKIPKDGDVINFEKGKIVSPNFPIIPYILGDGIGVDVTPVMIKVLDFAVKKAYKTKKKIRWLEIFAGKKDLIILISASGESANMIKAAKFCKVKRFKL